MALADNPGSVGVWLDREARPARSRQRTAQHRQQRPVSRAEVRTTRLPTQDRQLVSQNQDLQLLVGATRPSQQPDEREQVPDSEIRERPEQAGPSHSFEGKSTDTTPDVRTLDERRVRVCEPYGVLAGGYLALIGWLMLEAR